MPTLREIQEQFARHLQGLPTSPDIAKQVEFNQLENKQRLQVYQNNFKLSLTGNLAAIYPVIQKLVGEQFFNYACHEFIKDNPSKQGNLHEYGSEFAQFLQEFEPAKSLTYLADMARLEWAYHQVFHEADAGKFDIQALQEVNAEDYEHLIFSLHPATRLLMSRYPLTKIWQANQSENPGQITIEESDHYFLVGRRDNENIFQSLEKADYDFLLQIASSHTLGAVAALLQSQNDTITIDFNALLIKHVATGNICKFEVSREPQ